LRKSLKELIREKSGCSQEKKKKKYRYNEV
jgi:hypothetical protein